MLPANGWDHFCGESESVVVVECAEEVEDAVVVLDVADPKLGDMFV